MPIDPDALAESVARLEGVDSADAGLDDALELAAKETDDRLVVAADMAVDPRWPSVGPLAADHGIRAVLGVPIDLREGPGGDPAPACPRPPGPDRAGQRRVDGAP